MCSKVKSRKARGNREKDKKKNIGLQFLASALSKSGAFHENRNAFHAFHENRKNQIYELLGDHQV